MKNLLIILLTVVFFASSCKKNNTPGPDDNSKGLVKLKTITSSDIGLVRDMVELSDGSIVVLTNIVADLFYNRIQLVKYNSGGTVMWKKDFQMDGYPRNFGYSIQKDSEENLIVSGVLYKTNATYDDAWIIKTTKDGNKIWDKKIEDVTSEGGYAQGNLVITNTGDIVAVYNPGEGLQNACNLLLISANGSNVKTVSVPGTGYAGELKLLSDNNLAIAGTLITPFSAIKSKMVIVKVNLSGQILSSKEAASLTGQTQLFALTQMGQNIYVTGHYTPENGPRNFLFGKFSLGGEFIKMADFGRDFGEVGMSILALDNNNLVIGGYSEKRFSYELKGDRYFAILDAEGKVIVTENLEGDGNIFSIKKSTGNSFWLVTSGNTSGLVTSDGLDVGYQIFKYSYN